MNELETYRELSAKINLLHEEMGKLNKQKENLEKETARLSIENDREIERTERVKEEIEKQESLLLVCKAEYKKGLTSKDSLTLVLKTLQSKVDAIKAEKEALTVNIQDSVQKISDLELEYKALQSRIVEENAVIEKRKEALIKAITQV